MARGGVRDQFRRSERNVVLVAIYRYDMYRRCTDVTPSPSSQAAHGPAASSTREPLSEHATRPVRAAAYGRHDARARHPRPLGDAGPARVRDPKTAPRRAGPALERLVRLPVPCARPPRTAGRGGSARRPGTDRLQGADDRVAVGRAGGAKGTACRRKSLQAREESLPDHR